MCLRLREQKVTIPQQKTLLRLNTDTVETIAPKYSLVTDFLHNSFKSIESVPTCRSTTINYTKVSRYIRNKGQRVGFERNPKIRLSEDSLAISTLLLGRVHNIRGQSVRSLV